MVLSYTPKLSWLKHDNYALRGSYRILVVLKVEKSYTLRYYIIDFLMQLIDLLT